MLQIDEFFEWNCNIKITRQIEFLFTFDFSAHFNWTIFYWHTKFNFLMLRKACEIDMVLRYFAYDCYKLTKFSSQIEMQKKR